MLNRPRNILRRNHPSALIALAMSLLATGCLNTQAVQNAGTGGDTIENKVTPPADLSCAPQNLSAVAGAEGTAEIFNPDPMVRSGNANLVPNSSSLDPYRTAVNLSRLGGRGVLEGAYVDIRNGTRCDEWFGAYDPKNAFNYLHGDFRFQEAMSYYFGDRYRANLDAAGVLEPKPPVKIVVHCMNEDNAFYVKQRSGNGQYEGKVCIGDSKATPGASYADDSVVVLHELQHATTIDTYVAGNSSNPTLNQFWYDEAGALNEAVSDFMALIHTAPALPSPFDPRVFSRWALGTFFPGRSGVRGAHKCPTYDATYPNCTGFPAFSADQNRISYVYPDGLGWPYANNFQAPGHASSAFATYKNQEQIHNAGILMAGALWDVYEAIRANHGGDPAEAEAISAQVVMNALRNLPQPSLASLSPVTFRGFAEAMITAAGALAVSQADIDGMAQALTARGLLGGPSLNAEWAAVGPGKTLTPGLRVEDNPKLLKIWLSEMGTGTSVVTQGIETINEQADPGEALALWFDIRNMSQHSAGGIQLTITSMDPDLKILDGTANVGPISNQQAQINYGKIYGSNTVQALSSANPTFHVATGNSYFATNPHYGKDWTTAIWAKVSSTAPQGKSIPIQVRAKPSNGEAVTLTFQLTLK